MKPTIKEFFSISINDAPLAKYIAPVRRKAICDILLGKPGSATLLTGPRASGRSTVAAVSSILHAMNRGDNVLCISPNKSYQRHCTRQTIAQWAPTIAHNPKTWTFEYDSNNFGFVYSPNGARILMYDADMLSNRYLDLGRDFLAYLFYGKGVRFVWIEDLEQFEDPCRFIGYILHCPSSQYVKFIVNYHIESLDGPMYRAISMLHPIVASSLHLPMAKSFLHPKAYRLLRREKSDRQKRFAKEMNETPL